jgi:signal transduction histidine kinase
MRINWKTLLVLSTLTIALTLSTYALSESLLLERVDVSEKAYVQEDLNRVQMGLSFELSSLNSKCADWSNWDDTYDFIATGNSQYIETNLVPQAYNDLKINLMLFLNTNGSAVFYQAYNLANLSSIDVNQSLLVAEYPMLQNQNADEISGIVQLNQGIMMVSSQSILTSQYEGPPRGRLLMGVFLDEATASDLAQISGLPVTIYPMNEAQIFKGDLFEASRALSAGKEIFTKTINDSTIMGFTFIKDLNSNPVAIAAITDSRAEYAQAQTSTFYLGVSVAVVGILFLVISYFLLNWLVLSRLRKLKDSVEKIKFNETLKDEVDASGNDEISSLAQKINQMLIVIRSSQMKLNDYAQNLETKVNEKTTALAEAQSKLLQSERFAAVGQMAAMVGHDLRNPLTGIKTAIFYLKRTPIATSDEKNKKMLDLIEKDLDHASKILNDLLDFSREIKLEKETVNLSSLLSTSIRESRINEKVQITTSVDKNINAKVAPDKIQRVFVNLINNAVDAMPKGGSLTIDSKLNPNYVEISFSDTGIGISQENIDNLWKPLFTTKTKGIGLGLVICKRFVEAHGGQITVTSTLNKGTTFVVSIPFDDRVTMQSTDKEPICPRGIDQ